MEEQLYLQEARGGALGPYTKARVEELYRSGRISARSPVATDVAGPWTNVGVVLQSASKDVDVVKPLPGKPTTIMEPTPAVNNVDSPKTLSNKLQGGNVTITHGASQSDLLAGSGSGAGATDTTVRSTGEDGDSGSPPNAHLPRRASLVLARARLKSIGSTLQNKFTSSRGAGMLTKSVTSGGGSSAPKPDAIEDSTVTKSARAYLSQTFVSPTGGGGSGSATSARRLSYLATQEDGQGMTSSPSRNVLERAESFSGTDDFDALLASSVRDLTHDFSLVMERLEALQFVASRIQHENMMMMSNNSRPAVPPPVVVSTSDHAKLVHENEILKSFCRSVKSVVMEHAPSLLPENADTLFAPSSYPSPDTDATATNMARPSPIAAMSDPTTTTTIAEDPSSPRLVPAVIMSTQRATTAQSVSPRLQSAGTSPPDNIPSWWLPLDADSPMLRDRTALAEASLDELRQSIKQCIKSSSSFINGSATHIESGLLFAEDLLRSPSPEFKQLGEFLSHKLASRAALLHSIEGTFIAPLSKFAVTDLKGVHLARQELDRKRDIFESLESKVMAHIRKGKDYNKRGGGGGGGMSGTTSSFASTTSASFGSSMTTSMSAGGGGVGGADDNNVDKILNELRSAEANFEVSRCTMIRLLNQLNLRQMSLIQTSVGKVADSFTTYFHNESPKASRLVSLLETNSKTVSGDNALLERRMDIEYEERCMQLESYRNMGGGARHAFPARRIDSEPDLVHEGWLMKRSSNVIKDWKKRFFQLKGGALYYYRGSVPTHVADMMLCTVRTTTNIGGGGGSNSTKSSSGYQGANSSIDFSFELISNKRSFLLQASSEEDKEAWVSAIRKSVEKELGGTTTTRNTNVFEWATFLPNRGTSGDDGHDEVQPVNLGSGWAGGGGDVMGAEANKQCCDCHADLGDSPNWVSISLGAFICISCSGGHRALGTHVSKVRSLKLDTLSPSQIEILKKLGNIWNSRIWEAKSESCAIARMTTTLTSGDFVREKYQNRAFVEDAMGFSSDDALRAVENDDLIRLAYLVAHGVSMSSSRGMSDNKTTTPLHVAARNGSSACMCEFILLNGGSLDALDEDGKTPLEIVTLLHKNSPAEQVMLSWLNSGAGSGGGNNASFRGRLPIGDVIGVEDL